MATIEEKKSGTPWVRLLAGFGLLLPAIAACIGTLLLPTLQTVLSSLQEKNFFKPDQAKFIGFENYSRLFSDSIFAKAMTLTLSLLLVRVLVVAIVPLLLAFFANEFGRRVRIPLRLLFTVPLALFAPVAAAIAWGGAWSSETGIINTLLKGFGLPPQQWLTSVKLAPVSLMLIEGLTTFAIACGAGLVFYLAALRGPGEKAPSGRAVWFPLLASWIAGLLAVIVLPLPAFTTGQVLWQSSGQPGGSTLTLGSYLFKTWFLYGTIGYGSAMAVLILCIAVPAGLLLGLIAVLGRLRIEIVPVGKHSGLLSGEGKPGWTKILAGIFLAGMLCLSLLVCGLNLPPIVGSVLTSLKSKDQITQPNSPIWPAEPQTYTYEGKQLPVYRVPTTKGVQELALLTRGTRESDFIDPAHPEAGPIPWQGSYHDLKPVWVLKLHWENYGKINDLTKVSVAQLWKNTVFPPLAAIFLIQIPIAYLGALSIGAVRPLGKWSALLLLPFSPWLFVTIWPLCITFFEAWMKAGIKGTWTGLIPPIALSVPMLFILTLFFKGQEPKWRAAQAESRSPAGAFIRKIILPSLPLVALLACVSLLLSTQDFLWPLIVTATSSNLAPVSIYLARIAALYGQEPQLVAAASILFELPALVFFFLAFGLLQVFYLDRLALTTENSKRKKTDVTSAV